MSEVQLIRCGACGATNRVPLSKLQQGQLPVCGKCKSPLANGAEPASHPVTVTDQNFASLVEASPVPVLLDMWAPWCGPCRMIAPVVEELARELAGRLLVGKLNVDENPVMASRYNVRSIPALLILRGGRELDRIVGAQPKSEIVRHVERALSA